MFKHNLQFVHLKFQEDWWYLSDWWASIFTLLCSVLNAFYWHRKQLFALVIRFIWELNSFLFSTLLGNFAFYLEFHSFCSWIFFHFFVFLVIIYSFQWGKKLQKCIDRYLISSLIRNNFRKLCGTEIDITTIDGWLSLLFGPHLGNSREIIVLIDVSTGLIERVCTQFHSSDFHG